MNITGSAMPVLARHGQCLKFQSPEGETVLQYQNLQAYDATGRTLPTDLDLELRRLTIRVGIQDARLPVTVDPLLTNPGWQKIGDQSFTYLGYSVANAGDVNAGDVYGDGYSDIIVGAPKSNMHGNMAGNVCLYYGSEEGILEDPDVGVGYDREGRYGHSVSSAGDVNGDGYSDIIIGANKYDTLVPEPESGQVWVYHGSSEGIVLLSPNYCDCSQHARQAGAEFGHSVACAGDGNGDGFSDVIVGVPYYDSDLTDAGSVLVFHGASKGLASELSWQVEGDVSTAYIGLDVSSAGDVNGDGYSDLVLGAPYFTDANDKEGSVTLFLGSDSGPKLIFYDWRATGGLKSNMGFGSAVSACGDVNGDGYADVLGGAPDYEHDEKGSAFMYFGNGGPGHALRPRQLHSDNSGPIARLGLSSSPRAFRLASLAKTPFGRTSVKMEWEVKPFRADFDGADTGLSSVWQDTGRTGVELTELVDGLSPGMLYHWRLRLRYHPATIPYQPAGPWLTNQAVKGWEEAVLRTCRPIISPWLPLLLQDED